MVICVVQGKAVPSGPKAEDGRFWMEWSDFCTCFDNIDACYFNFSEVLLTPPAHSWLRTRLLGPSRASAVYVG